MIPQKDGDEKLKDRGADGTAKGVKMVLRPRKAAFCQLE
jgi:hypothetical protein